MDHILFLLFLLSNASLGLAMATNKPQISDQSISEPPSNSNPPTQSASYGQRTHTAEPSTGRKLGKHQHKQVSFSITPSPSPSEAPQSGKKMQSSSEGSVPNHQRNSVEQPHYDEVLGSQGGVYLSKQHHHSFDKSIAGGGVILGGLATTFLVSVFCYIRATGRQKSEITA